MGFVANSTYGNWAGGALPLGSDVSGNIPAFNLFSHLRFQGAGTVTFDTGQVVTGVAGIDTVAPVPTGARSAVLGSITSVQLGKVD